MAKQISYPTAEWIDRWMDAWMDKHPDERVTDFDELRAQAEDAWWLNEIEHNRPTPFDLTAEQEKASKEARKGMARADKEPKQTAKRERKPNEEKRHIIDLVRVLFEGLALNGEAHSVNVANAEREITFAIGENEYSLTLTCHRKPKPKG